MSAYKPADLIETDIDAYLHQHQHRHHNNQGQDNGRRHQCRHRSPRSGHSHRY